jgi:Tol biopolymer transport system component
MTKTDAMKYVMLLGLWVVAPAAVCEEERDTGCRTSHEVADARRGECHRQSIQYDGLGPLPGRKTALPFGRGLISFPESNERVVAIHPGGKELFYTGFGPRGPQIMQSLYRNGRWQPAGIAPFSDAGFNVEPSISPDGNTLFFISTRPPSRGTDIWAVKRAHGRWGSPMPLSDAVNSDGFEWHPQVIANGNLYFAAEDRSDSFGGPDLYVATFENGQHLPAENLGPTVNTRYREWDGHVSPDGSYLIFKSDRPGGYGGLDMYLSRNSRRSWSVPRNLGSAINTADDEDAGDVTPDGCFLVFARSPPGAQSWDLYWIDAGALRVGHRDGCRQRPGRF